MFLNNFINTFDKRCLVQSFIWCPRFPGDLLFFSFDSSSRGCLFYIDINLFIINTIFWCVFLNVW